MPGETPDFERNADVEYFQHLADGAPVMIWMSGSDMGCFYFNRAWLDYRGRTLEQEFGDGWAEGVHQDDLERCVRHYVGSFERRVPFAMSYRLQHRSGEHRWILDRGAPHYAADGEFLGFYGGCAEIATEATIPRMTELRQALYEMRMFAERIATAEALTVRGASSGPEVFEDREGIRFEPLVRQHAAVQIGMLAADMLSYERIENGACLQ